MANLLLDPNVWEDQFDNTPHPSWDGTAYAVSVAPEVPYIFELNFIGTVAPGDIIAATVSGSAPGPAFINFVVDFVVVGSVEIGVDTSFSFEAQEGMRLIMAPTADANGSTEIYGLNVTVTPTALPVVSYNCTCSDAGGRVYRTLKDLRDAIMRRLGWGNQLLNPPPGSVEMINSFLYEAQYSLYYRFNSLRMERFFTWDLVDGVNLYGIGDNIEECARKLNPDKIKYVGTIRDGGLWTRLIAGIPPVLNSYPQTTRYPIRYEIRQCIQVWPVPGEDAGQLIIKGNFDLLPFADDTDVCSVDDSLIFALALADAKAHYRQPDADRYIQRAEVLLNGLVAGTHTTKRYVPGVHADSLEPLYVDPVAEGGFQPWPGA